MNGWKIFSVMILALFVLAVPTMAAELDEKLDIRQFEVNDVTVDFYEDSTVDQEFERGEELEIMLNLEALEDVDDLEIQAFIAGDKYVKNRRDLTYDFDTYRGTLDQGNAKKFKMYITIPQDLEIDNNGEDDEDDDYKLRIVIADADSPGIFAKDFQLTIQGLDEENAINIEDFSFSPQEVVVGRAFTSLVRVENLGDEDIDDLKVTVSVPALNIKDTQYLDSDDEIEPDDYQTFEELLLRLPMDAKPGTYDVDVTVEFDKYYKTTAKGRITVVEEKSASNKEDKSLITVTPSQEIAAGTSAIYPILIENTGDNSKTYTVAVTGLADWATYKLEPSSVSVVEGNSKETVLLTITPNQDASTGEKSFVITIDAPEGTVQKAVTATITSSGNSTNWGKVQDGLTIGLIILVIILIILGLIIGFSKLRGSSDKEDESQTYY